jgi:hypothetical protein
LRKMLRRCVSTVEAEEQLRRDLRVGLAVDDQRGDLQLALGERGQPFGARDPRPRTAKSPSMPLTV